jgi:hypothetical protein
VRLAHAAEQIEAEEDERQIGEGVAEQNDAEETAGVLKELDEGSREVSTALFQPLDVEGLEREKSAEAAIRISRMTTMRTRVPVVIMGRPGTPMGSIAACQAHGGAE